MTKKNVIFSGLHKACSSRNVLICLFKKEKLKISSKKQRAQKESEEGDFYAYLRMLMMKRSGKKLKGKEGNGYQITQPSRNISQRN